MLHRRSLVVAALAVSTGLSSALTPALLAEGLPATRPTTAATTQATTRASTTASAKATTMASTRSASQATTQAKKFPTPTELIEQMKAKQKEAETFPRVAVIDIDRAVTEKPAGLSLFGSSGGIPLHSLLERIQSALDDKDVRAIVITLAASADVSLSQATEIRDALTEFRKAGKKAFVYADGYDTATYTLASGATDIVLLEGGEVFMPGIGIENQFYKGLMEKVGVKGDYVQVGEFKGAEEPYVRSSPSPELAGEMTKLVEGLYDQVTRGIARSRDLPLPIVTAIVDDAMIPARAAKDRGLVDHLSDRDALRDLLARELNAKQINPIFNYAAGAKPEMDFSNPFALLSAMSKRPEPTSRETVALVIANGTIVDGRGGGGGLFGGGGDIGSEDIRDAMKQIKDDPNVKAVVIRIDSPGGSALASEVMWQSVRKIAAEKPVIISIGSMAASGGYYLASAGDYIIADPTAIVGSIGVVGGKFVLSGLYEKLGITSQTYSKGRNADLFSSSAGWSENQRRMIRQAMKTTYEQFTDRIMTTRKGKIADIDAVARGRVFVAADAVKLGMVDELGGLNAAIREAAEREGLERGKYDVRVFPMPRNPLEEMMGALEGGAPMPMAENPALAGVMAVAQALPPRERAALAGQLRFVKLLSQRPVVLHLPYVIHVK